MRFVGIDPASHTGFVALDARGGVLKQKELTGIGEKDPKRMVTLIHDITAHFQEGDFTCIEGFPYNTQRAMFAGGLHHGIRNELWKRKITYYEAAPNAVKKWVGVTGFVGETGSKKRLDGDEKKQAVMDAIFKEYDVRFTNDNIADAFILAKIARAVKAFQKNPDIKLPKHKKDVIMQILHPQPKKKKTSRKKKKPA